MHGSTTQHRLSLRITWFMSEDASVVQRNGRPCRRSKIYTARQQEVLSINRPTSGPRHDADLPAGRTIQLLACNTEWTENYIRLKSLASPRCSRDKYRCSEQFSSGAEPKLQDPMWTACDAVDMRLFESASMMLYLAENTVNSSHTMQGEGGMNRLMWQMGGRANDGKLRPFMVYVSPDARQEIAVWLAV